MGVRLRRTDQPSTAWSFHMIQRFAKSLALRIPRVRRVHDGMEAMRRHIDALERTLAERTPAPTRAAAAIEMVHFID